MKVLTVIGTRPEVIRLNLIIKKLDEYLDKHILVHTGQNFTYTLNEVFFKEMNVRKPDYILHDKQQGLGEQLATMFVKLEKILQFERPDKVLVLGDTNSALSAILAERVGVPVVHMEAGNRCFDRRVPEEINRRVIDAVSTFSVPYTLRSKENLLKEGMPTQRIMVSGNPIFEVLQHYKSQIDQSLILKKLNLEDCGYFLVTAHRAENIDDPAQLSEILRALSLIAQSFKRRLICSTHPRTRSQLESNKQFKKHSLVEFHEPFGFFDFVKLEKHALGVLTDSGTVQEECCIFHVPTVTMRNSTERPETVDCGSNMVSGVNANRIYQAANLMVQQSSKWECPQGYEDPNVSAKIIKFLLGGSS